MSPGSRLFREWKHLGFGLGMSHWNLTSFKKITPILRNSRPKVHRCPISKQISPTHRIRVYCLFYGGKSSSSNLQCFVFKHSDQLRMAVLKSETSAVQVDELGSQFNCSEKLNRTDERGRFPFSSVLATQSRGMQARRARLRPIEILQRLFPSEQQSALALLLQGCNGDVATAIEYFLSAGDAVMNVHLVSRVSELCPASNPANGINPQPVRKLNFGGINSAFTPLHSPVTTDAVFRYRRSTVSLAMDSRNPLFSSYTLPVVGYSPMGLLLPCSPIPTCFSSTSGGYHPDNQ